MNLTACAWIAECSCVWCILANDSLSRKITIILCFPSGDSRSRRLIKPSNLETTLFDSENHALNSDIVSFFSSMSEIATKTPLSLSAIGSDICRLLYALLI